MINCERSFERSLHSISEAGARCHGRQRWFLWHMYASPFFASDRIVGSVLHFVEAIRSTCSSILSSTLSQIHGDILRTIRDILEGVHDGVGGDRRQPCPYIGD